VVATAFQVKRARLLTDLSGMWRLLLISILLVIGATALARGLYLQRQLSQQLDTGAMGAIRSWVMWSTTDGRELVTWYRTVTPWLIGGGSTFLLCGMVLAVRAPQTTNSAGGKKESREEAVSKQLLKKGKKRK
jgi:hypothetical protein